MFFVLSLLIAIIYFTYAIIKIKKIPESLSATYYELNDKKWAFQLALTSVVATLLPEWLNVSNNNTQWLAFLSCAGLLLVAASPHFKENLQSKIHYTSAIVCGTCAVLWQILNGMWEIPFIFAVISLILTLTFKKWMWWLELGIMGSLFTSLFKQLQTL